MQVSTMIRQELAKKGFTNLKDAAKFLGVSTELLRTLVNKGRMPKDRLLIRIADRLGLDRASLVLAAHKQKVPREMHGFFLEPQKPAGGVWDEKRKWPLSQEQCEYLSKLMSEQEIQLVRKYRQLAEEQRTQTQGYIDYHFETARQQAAAAGQTGNEPSADETAAASPATAPASIAAAPVPADQPSQMTAASKKTSPEPVEAVSV